MRIFKTLHGSVHAIDDIIYFAGDVSYMRKMFMKSNTGVNTAKSFET